jgi:hypothetical protein
VHSVLAPLDVAGDGNFGTRPGQQSGDRETDARSAAGDQRGLALQLDTV